MNAGSHVLRVALRDRLSMLVQKVLGPGATPIDRFPVDQRLSDLGMSSIKLVSLMLAVEAEFKIEIPQAEMTPENFHSVISIQALLERIRRPLPPA